MVDRLIKAQYRLGRGVFGLIWGLRRRFARSLGVRRALMIEVDRERRRLAQIETQIGLVAGESEQTAVLKTGLAVNHGQQVPSGTIICRGLSLYHDAVDKLPSWRMLAVTPTEAALRLTCYEFDGGFMSLAVAIPDTIMAEISRTRSFSLILAARASRPLALHARLNFNMPGGQVTHHRYRILDGQTHDIHFDLSIIDLPKPGEQAMWVDLILRSPAMAEIQISDISFETAQPAAVSRAA